MGIEVLKGLFVKEDVGERELSEPKLDKQLTIKYSNRHRGSIRLSQGRYYTASEWEKRRKYLRNLPMP
jgi:hypothetical protein